jgi:integrase
MATLRTSTTGIFSLLFRYPPGRAGRHFNRSLETRDETDANEAKALVERTIRHVKEGVLQLPPQPTDDDLWQFLRSGGRVTRLPSLAKRARLGDVVQAFKDAEKSGSKEAATLTTELRHTNNLKRHLGERTWFDEIGPGDLRRYVTARKDEPGIRGGTVKNDTIRKELDTFRQLWAFAASEGYVSGDNPVSRIRLPKKNRKPPFMTWEQIEAKIERGGMTDVEKADIWDSLFLREEEIGEFLRSVKAQAQTRNYPFIYPAIAFCAYTGARRSEMFRCEIDDVGTTITLREKKAEKDMSITFRHVPLHPKLRTILDEWLLEHPGGQHLFVKRNGNPLEDRTSRDAFEAVTKGTKWSVLRGYHVLRHSFASNLARHGVAEHRIREYMGHHTDDMARRYRHLFPEDKQSDIERLAF